MKQLAILLTVLWAAIQAPGGIERYVPTTGWQDNAREPAFFERWYGKQLRAMNERPLSTAANLEGWRERFRLLVLPNYEPALVYRIDIAADGSAVLRWAKLDGAGGYDPGQIAEEHKRVLPPHEIQLFKAALKDAALMSRPRQAKTADTDGKGSVTICIHATVYVFEYLDEDDRQFVQRDSCDMEYALRGLGKTLSLISATPPNR